jgi:hypothetical protein
MSIFSDIGELVDVFLSGAAAAAGNGSAGGHQRTFRNCRALGWSVDEVKGNHVLLHFNDSQAVGGIRKVAVFNGDEGLVAFRCLSHAFLPRGRQVPEEVLGYLLVRNGERAVGAWGLSVTDQSVAFALDYTALGDAFDPPALKFICGELVAEASAFDAKMRAAGLLR